jgi:putative addiction module component (TIGR02574 family)
MPTLDYSHLSARERLDLIGEIWESIDAEAVPLTAAQEAELARRLETFDDDIKQGTPWEDFEAELDHRYS